MLVIIVHQVYRAARRSALIERGRVRQFGLGRELQRVRLATRVHRAAIVETRRAITRRVVQQMTLPALVHDHTGQLVDFVEAQVLPYSAIFVRAQLVRPPAAAEHIRRVVGGRSSGALGGGRVR